MMVLLAKPVDQAIVLNPDKADEFINKRIDPEVKAEILRKAERIRKTYVWPNLFIPKRKIKSC